MSKLLLLPLFLLLGWLWSLDVTDARYATRADWAHHDGGWLPPILPGSAHDIHTVNDLDFNISQGEFEFSDTDAGDFFARLSLDVPHDAPFQDWPGILEDYRESGQVAWSYQDGSSVWVFFCDPVDDACDYRMWAPRNWKARLASVEQGHAGHGPQ